MKHKITSLLVVLMTLFIPRANAQFLFTEDPYDWLLMDIEAVQNSARLWVMVASKDFNRYTSIYPKVELTMMNGEELVLTGRANSSRKGNFTGRYYSTWIEFRISPQQAELFKYGLKKIKVPMMARLYSHEWEDDVLGWKLYEKYKESLNHSIFKTANQ